MNKEKYYNIIMMNKGYGKTYHELQMIEKQHKKINGELRERIAYLERSNDRREDTILGLRQEINDVEDKNSKLEIALQNIQEDYKSRCEKAIEYIKENEFYLDYKTGACIKGVMPLLNILQNGSEKE